MQTQRLGTEVAAPFSNGNIDVGFGSGVGVTGFAEGLSEFE